MISVSEMMAKQFPITRKIKTFYEDRSGYRLNLVTDDISSNSLFGGVATALIFASLLCEKNNWTLRLITRNNLCNLNDYFEFMRMVEIKTPKEVEMYSDVVFGGESFNRKLEIKKGDVFFATSWWSAKSIMDSCITNRIIYILQEVETFFYEYGDMRFLCDEIMKSYNIDFLINTKLLYDYLADNGYDNIKKNGKFFEPAFPKHIYYADVKRILNEKNEKHRLFFYGRPRNARNLYYMGVRCLNRAILDGIIDTNIWDIYFAGKNDSEQFEFDNGYIPFFSNQLGWKEYADFARKIDVSFSLMYTPHPSYPPFDMVSSGAIAITNEFGNKKNLHYSNNMITKPLDEKAIVEGIEEAMKLALDTEKRLENYNSGLISRNWEDSFGELIDYFTTKIEGNEYVCY